MTTSIDDGVATAMAQLTAIVQQQRRTDALGSARGPAPAAPLSSASLGGSMSARRDGGRSARLAAAAASTAQSHGIPVEPTPVSSRRHTSAAGASNRIGRGAGSESASIYGGGGAAVPPAYTSTAGVGGTGELHHPRTWEHMPLRALDDVRQPRRYFSQRQRRVLYAPNFWSAPLQRNRLSSSVGASGGSSDVFVSGGPGGSGEGVLVRPLERKLLPVQELLRRIEDAQAAQAAREAEAKRAPIRARHRQLRLARGLPLPEGGGAAEDAALAALDAEHIDLLAALDSATLQSLKAEFLATRSRALGLDAFVRVMRRYLPRSLVHSQPGAASAAETTLAANLCAFFESVDVNGDGTMEWSEFTSYITDTGLANLTAGGSAGVGGGVAGPDSRPALGEGAGGAPEEYRKSTSLVDEHPWTQPLDRLFYFEPIDQLVAFQKNLNRFDAFKAKRLNHIATVQGHTGPMLAAEYLEADLGGSGNAGSAGNDHSSNTKHKLVVTSANDRTLRFWDPLEGYRPSRLIGNGGAGVVGGCDAASVALRWAQSTNSHRGILFGATDRAMIKAWRIERSSGGSAASSVGGAVNSSFVHSHSSAASSSKLHATYHLECSASFSSQSDISLDLLVLDNMSSLASGSLDGTVALFDIQTCHRNAVLKGGHARGVFQLAYHNEFHVLVSAGFEHAATVWNPYVAAKICKLTGHYSPLVGVQCVPGGSPQILTADRGGIVKVWDMRNFACVQTLYVEDERDQRVGELNAFVSCAPHKRILSASHRIFVHESLTSSASQSPALADEAPTISARYNTNSGLIVSASGGGIRLWNASSGALERSFPSVIPHAGTITAICLDDAQRKVITGDSLGTLRVFNALTGAAMKSVLVSPGKELTSVEYIPQLKNILTTSWDGSVSLWDENPPEGIPLIKRLKNASSSSSSAGVSSRGGRPNSAGGTGGNGHEIITTAFSENLTLFATGSSNGLVALWDYRAHVNAGEMSGHASEITALAFLDPYPLLASADNEGNICIWVVRPVVLNVGKCVLRLINTVKGVPAPVAQPSAATDEEKGDSSKNKARLASRAAAAAASTAAAVCPVTALAFWTSVDARSYIASLHDDPGSEPLAGTSRASPSTQPHWAMLFAGDVHGVVRSWNIWGAIQRWKMLPFYSHDCLLPTGAMRDGAQQQHDESRGGAPVASIAGEQEEDPYALTDAEKRRMLAQIQANGLSAGGEKTAHMRKSSTMTPEAALAAAEEASLLAGGFAGDAAVVAPTKPSRAALPDVVAELVASNLQPFTARSAAVQRVLEMGNNFGDTSVEYEAALAAVPGATASSWAARQAQLKRQQASQARAAQAAQHAAAVKAAKELSLISPTGSPARAGATRSLQRSASVAAVAAVLAAEEKEADADTDVASGSVADASAALPTPALPAKFHALTANKGPVVSNSFSRGNAKLRAATSRDNTGAGSTSSSGAPSALRVSAGDEDDVTAVSLGSPRLMFPTIPLLPLSSLLAGGGEGALPTASATPIAGPSSGSAAALVSGASFLPKALLRHSRANDYVEYRRVHRDLMNALEKHARARTQSLQPGDITLAAWWPAHTDSIRDLRVIREEAFGRQRRTGADGEDSLPSAARAPRLHPFSCALLSCGFDRRVCLWSRDGASLGHLQQGRTDDHSQFNVLTDDRGVELPAAAACRPPAGTQRPDWLVQWRFHSDVRGRYERAQGTARRVLQRLESSEQRERNGDSHRARGASASRSSRQRTAAPRHPASLLDLSSSDGESDDDDAYAYGDGSTTAAGDTFVTQLGTPSLLATRTASRPLPQQHQTPRAPAVPSSSRGGLSSRGKPAPQLQAPHDDLLTARVREAARTGVLIGQTHGSSTARGSSRAERL